MYHLLVADDEPRHRRGIADMIRTLRPDYQVFLAKDGEEALQIVDANRIDIILTDIRMPKIDGLQLIERLGNRTEAIKVVILSVYGYFDYARQAIKLGAFDYVLKPVETNDMAQMLAKLEAALEKERKRHRDGETLKHRLNSAIPVYEQHLLNRWVRADISEEELSEIARLFPNGGTGFVLLTKFNKHNIGYVYTPDEFDEVKGSLRNWMAQALQALGASISFYLEGPESVLVSVIAPDEPFERLRKQDIDGLSSLIDQFRIEFGLSGSIGVGDRCVDIVHEVSTSFEQARKALDFTFYCGQEHVISHSKIAYDPYKPALNTFPSEARIRVGVRQLNREEATDALKALMDQLLHGKYPSPTHLKESILYVLVNQVRSVETLLRAEETNNLIVEMEFQIPECASLQELKIKAGQYLCRMIANIENRRNNKNQLIIQMCMEYLQQHYMDDLSLDMVARKFYFSPAYFSSFFKSHTSMTFTDFLLQLRIQKAKAFLLDGERKVSEIALSVGFRDAGYFTRIFKREVGLSPEDYRKNTVM